MEFSKSSFKKEVYSDTIIPQETGKALNTQLNATFKQLEKEEQKSSKVSTRKDIIKIRAEISQKEMKETLAKTNN